jgi:hypothetical protein
MCFTGYLSLQAFTLPDFRSDLVKELNREVDISGVLGVPNCATLSGSTDVIRESEGFGDRHFADYTGCVTLNWHILYDSPAGGHFPSDPPNDIVRRIYPNILDRLEND